MGSALVLYARLIGAEIRAQMQYPSSFLLQLAGTFASTGSELVAVLVLFGTFTRLAGWTVAEVALLYALAAISFAVADLLAGQLDAVSGLLRSGGFDRLLLRPAPVILQVVASAFPLRRLGRLAQGLVALALAQVWLGLRWDAARGTIFASGIAGGALVYAALMLVGAALCFWTTERTELQNVFTYGGNELARYPLHIYDGWLRTVFLWIVPVGLTIYYPALAILGKPDPLGLPPWTGYLALPAGALSVTIAWLVWRAGMRRYSSTGS